MANVIPVKATFTSSTVTGLAEFQSGDTIDISTYLSASSITFAGDSGSDSASLGETLTIAGGTNITTAATSNTITINLDSNVVTETSTDTLTNKSIDLANNTITGTTAEFNTALSDGSFATLAGSETLTNKTISGSSNTLSNIANSSLTNSSITFAGDSGSDGASLGETLTVAGGTSISTAVTSNTVTINLGTIDASSTTISNIPNSSLSNSSITFAGDSGSDSASLGETLTIAGTSNEIETTGTSNTITIGLPNNVTIGNDLTVSNDLTVTGDLTVNGTTTTVNSTTIEITNSFTFEGSTANDFETVLGVVDPTADRTINLPDVSGTVITSGNLSDITSVGTLSSLTMGASGITFDDGSTQTSAGASNAFAIAQAVALG
jgi:hypothetical protein